MLSVHCSDSLGNNNLAARNKYYLERFHGCLMIAAWIMLSMTTSFTAYYHKEYPEQQPGSVAFWLQVTFDLLDTRAKERTTGLHKCALFRVRRYGHCLCF